MTVGHCTVCLRHNIHIPCDLQTIDAGKNISILMGKLRENDVEKFCTNPVQYITFCWNKVVGPTSPCYIDTRTVILWYTKMWTRSLLVFQQLKSSQHHRSKLIRTTILISKVIIPWCYDWLEQQRLYNFWYMACELKRNSNHLLIEHQRNFKWIETAFPQLLCRMDWVSSWSNYFLLLAELA